jgi:hypothetical protein
MMLFDRERMLFGEGWAAYPSHRCWGRSQRQQKEKRPNWTWRRRWSVELLPRVIQINLRGAVATGRQNETEGERKPGGDARERKRESERV